MIVCDATGNPVWQRYCYTCLAIGGSISVGSHSIEKLENNISRTLNSFKRNQKNPCAHKIKIGTSTPLPKKSNPTLKRGILWAWELFSRKNQTIPGAHKIGAAISGPAEIFCPRIARTWVVGLKQALGGVSVEAPEPHSGPLSLRFGSDSGGLPGFNSDVWFVTPTFGLYLWLRAWSRIISLRICPRIISGVLQFLNIQLRHEAFSFNLFWGLGLQG